MKLSILSPRNPECLDAPGRIKCTVSDGDGGAATAWYWGAGEGEGEGVDAHW